jgi:hypothetical protein
MTTPATFADGTVLGLGRLRMAVKSDGMGRMTHSGDVYEAWERETWQANLRGMNLAPDYIVEYFPKRRFALLCDGYEKNTARDVRDGLVHDRSIHGTVIEIGIADVVWPIKVRDGKSGRKPGHAVSAETERKRLASRAKTLAWQKKRGIEQGGWKKERKA